MPEVELTGLLDVCFSKAVEVPTHPERNSGHVSGGGEQAVVLATPPLLPQELRVAVGENPLVVQYVGIPLPPFSGGPPDGRGREIDDVTCILGRHSGDEPRFDLRRDERGCRALQCHETSTVVEQDLEETAVSERPETLVDSRGSILGRGPRQTRGAIWIGEKLRVVEALRGPGQLKHEVIGRECDDLFIGVVVFEVVVVVLQEKDRRGPKTRAVQFGDLRVDHPLE